MSPGPPDLQGTWDRIDSVIGSQAQRLARAATSPAFRARLARRVRALRLRALERRTAEVGPVRFEAGSDQRRPTVSIVVPTAGESGLVDGSRRRYVSALMESLIGTLAEADEVLIVIGPEAPDGLAPELAGYFGTDPRLQVVTDTDRFSFAGRVNLGVAASAGEVVLLCNDDTEVIDGAWLDKMSRAAAVATVGAVGATLLYEDGSLQHAGLTTIDGLPTHAWSGWDPEADTDGGILAADRLAWAVTGAALAVRRSVWDQLGGFSMRFPINYNDVDFCAKAAHIGLDNVVLGSTRLRHFETRTRARELHESEVDALRKRWAHRLGPDPLVAGTSALVVKAGPGDDSSRDGSRTGG